MSSIFVTPVAGRRVRFPDAPQRVLDTSGEHVPDTPFWQARILEGDVSAPHYPAPVRAPDAELGVTFASPGDPDSPLMDL